VLALADVLRSLEHHVLKEMCEPGAAGVFVVRAHVVGDGDPIGRGGMIDRHDDAKAIVQLVLFNRNPQGFWRGLSLNQERTGQERGNQSCAHMCNYFTHTSQTCQNHNC